MTTPATASTDQQVGLFPVAYAIGTGMPGAVNLAVHLLVNTPAKTVVGYGKLTQAISPPLALDPKLEGTFTYMTVMPNQTSILVVITGYPATSWPPNGGTGPVLMPTLHLRMVLDDNWQKGTANLSYFSGGTWHELTDQPVSILA